VTAVWRGIDRIEVTFDEPNLAANAGLVLVATLVVRLGLERLINASVDLSGRIGGVLVRAFPRPVLGNPPAAGNEGLPCLKAANNQIPVGPMGGQTMAPAHCIAKIAATSRTGSTTIGPVEVTSARKMVPLKAKGAE